MKLLGCLCLGLAMASVHGAFLESGKELTYDLEVRLGAGTMDYVPHSAGTVFKFLMKLQTKTGSSLVGKIYNAKMAEYVGPVNPGNMDSNSLAFGAMPLDTEFTINLQNGLISSIKIGDGLTLAQQNVIKGFLANFQLNEKVMNGGSFKSQEQTIHGECGVTYTVTTDTIYKSMNLDSDCPNRPVRRVDDIGGYDCEREDQNKAAGLVSASNTVYSYKSSGDGFKITSLRTSGAFVAQMYETEGVSYIAMVNSTATLIDDKVSPGGLTGGSNTINSLAYTFADTAYQYNVDRDLKAVEPFLATGCLYEDASQAALKDFLLTLISKQEDLLNAHGNEPETIQEAHTFGIDKISPVMAHMEYATLMQIFDELIGDKSTSGVMKSNIFTELLGSTGTTASAMVVRDLLVNNRFDNCRDASRVLISVPFHIRRPNTQLVAEFEKLMTVETECEYIKEAIPLVLGHLVKETCTKAGAHKKNGYEDKKACALAVAKPMAERYFQKFVHTSDRKEKNMYLSAIHNIKFGGIADLLQPLIDGSLGESSEMRVLAIWAALTENFYQNQVVERYFPVFAEKTNSHEVRIAAVTALLSKTPTITDMARVISVLRNDQDFEVINYVYTKLEDMANSISPCDKKSSEVASFFLKYLKQFSQYKASYQFGVSKTFSRQFVKKKYGYSGTYSFTTVGAHDSTTPISVGMGVSSTVHNNYKAHDVYTNLRIEGLAKAVINKFKSMDPSVFKTENLQAIFQKMAIEARPSQPIRVGYTVVLKGTIAFAGSIDIAGMMSEGTDNEGLSKVMSTFQSLGKSINHQRIFNPISITVEQPTDLGFPALYAASLHGMFSIKAKGERKQTRGLIVMEAGYDAHLFMNARNVMSVQFPGQKKLYGIVQDRVYHMHSPRDITIGVQPIRREVKLAMSRPEKEHPAMFMMHAQTTVVAQPCNKPSLPAKAVIVSRGPTAARSRTVLDVDNDKVGMAAKFEYFDCEMDVDKSNTAGRALYAFMPFNKSPKTPYNSLVMGMRQISSFVLLFPRAEKCGIYAAYSQSSVNPTRKIELSVRGESEKKGEKLFLRGGKLTVKATLKAIGDNTRSYRMILVSDQSPGGLTKKIKMELDRAPVASLGVPQYKICLAYFAKYPPFAKEMFDVDMENNMKVYGKAKVQYGVGNNCKTVSGAINADFEYSTTDEARLSLKNKDYYKECMAKKNSPAMREKKGLPLSFACLRTAYDASTARKYYIKMTFEKMSERLTKFIKTAKTVVKAVALPTLGLDAIDIDPDNIGKFAEITATLKNDDRNVDVTLKTASGTKEIKDYPLRLDYTRSLRNLQFKSQAESLFRMGVIKPCQATEDTIVTMDNVTLNYDIPSCYTLMSGHCAANPSYAVFIKKSGGSLPMAMKAYIGGYEIDIDPSTSKVTVDGRRVRVTDTREYFQKTSNNEVFKITKWGSTYNIYSFLRVWIVFDGSYVNVVPAPSVKGQHCGICGNYNRNRYDEMTGKDGVTVFNSVQEFVNDYKYQC